jgi:hypothetical protein
MFQLTVHARRTPNAVPPDLRPLSPTSQPGPEDRRAAGSPLHAASPALAAVLAPGAPRPAGPGQGVTP